MILVTLLGSSLIRQLHEFIPDWTPLPWPVRSPLYALLTLFFLILVASWSRDRTPRRHPLVARIRLGALAPLLIALVYEKVLSLTLYEALLDHALRIEIIRNHLDVWIHILIGLGMMIAVLLLIPLMNRVGFRNFLTLAQVRSGFYLQFFALALAYGAVAGLAIFFSRSGETPVLLFPVGATALLFLAGQGMRAMAEEFYYRGLLQRELSGLMSRLGVRDQRSGQAVAISLIALGFGMEHFRFGAPLAQSYHGFAYAVAVGFLFGYLLVLTGNVFFCGLVHATNNYVTANLLPHLGSPDGNLLVPTDTILYLYLVAVFLLVFLVNGMAGRRLRDVLLPDARPPVQA
jgi:membrane protease YdiL (CAAX protease family)